MGNVAEKLGRMDGALLASFVMVPESVLQEIFTELEQMLMDWTRTEKYVQLRDADAITLEDKLARAFQEGQMAERERLAMEAGGRMAELIESL